MLGPLTNLALAMREDDAVLSVMSRVKAVYIMGGAIHHPTPGTHGRQEMNMFVHDDVS